MEIKIKNKIRNLKGKYKIKTFKAGTNEILRETDWINNLIVLNENNGLYIVLERIIGVKTYDIEITQAKIGDDDTAPTTNDTDLGNVVVDGILVALKSRNGDDERILTFFIGDADLPNGSYKEFGIFAGDQLFARSIITPTYTKASGEDTQITYSISASAS